MIEVIITVFIVMIAFMGIIAVSSSVINGNAFSKDVTFATSLAQQQMEQLRIEDYGNLSNETSINSIYTTVTTITDNAPENNMKTITVTTQWSRGGTSRSVTLRTIRGE